MAADYYGSNQAPLWYYLIFPIDAWVKPQDQEYVVFQAQKQKEIFPIMMILMPLIVLLSGFFLDLGLFGNILFFAVEAVLLGGVSMFYAKLSNMGFIVELILNLWLSFLLMAICMALLAFFVGTIF